MFNPAYIHVIVHKAENLLIKGKNGTNNAFVVIELGKESYRTSVKENSGKSVSWHEECELKIPKAGNTACLVLTALHRNSLGLDQYLGSVRIPLMSLDQLQRTIEWYKLEGKRGKEKGKEKIRGKLEVEIGFTSRLQSLSLTSLQPGKSSFEKLTGSLFGLGPSDRKTGVRKLANSLGRAVLRKKKRDVDESCEDFGDKDNSKNNNSSASKSFNNLDPGVVSDDDDHSSHKSSESLSEKIYGLGTPPPKPQRSFLRNPQISISNWEDGSDLNLTAKLNLSQESVRSTGKRKIPPKLGELQDRLADRRLSSSCVDFSLLSSPKPEKKFSSSLNLEKTPVESNKRLSKFARRLRNFHSVDKKDVGRTVEGCEEGTILEESSLPKLKFKNKNKDELINMVLDLQKKVNCVSVRVKDLEDYLDEILLKVMETVPKILEKS